MLLPLDTVLPSPERVRFTHMSPLDTLQLPSKLLLVLSREHSDEDTDILRGNMICSPPLPGKSIWFEKTNVSLTFSAPVAYESRDAVTFPIKPLGVIENPDGI
jgi:hypothetical protein